MSRDSEYKRDDNLYTIIQGTARQTAGSGVCSISTQSLQPIITAKKPWKIAAAIAENDELFLTVR